MPHTFLEGVYHFVVLMILEGQSLRINFWDDGFICEFHGLLVSRGMVYRVGLSFRVGGFMNLHRLAQNVTTAVSNSHTRLSLILLESRVHRGFLGNDRLLVITRR